MVGGAVFPPFNVSPCSTKIRSEEDPENHLLMHAVSANVSGQIASVLAGGNPINCTRNVKDLMNLINY